MQLVDHVVSSASGDASTIVQIIMVLIGAGGFGGFFLALLKLRPEANSAAVTQAQGANETLVTENEILHNELLRVRAEREHLFATVKEQEELVMQLRQMIRGMSMMEEDDK